MSKTPCAYYSAPLPQLPDGRTFVSDMMLKEDPSLRSLVSRGHNFWQYDIHLRMWVSPRLEDRG